MLCVSLLSVCFVSIFSLCSVRFLVCVLFLFLVCVMCLCTLASLRSAGARFARCGRFAAAVAITPNIIVFVVRGLTFVNVSALGRRSSKDCQENNAFGDPVSPQGPSFMDFQGKPLGPSGMSRAPLGSSGEPSAISRHRRDPPGPSWGILVQDRLVACSTAPA